MPETEARRVQVRVPAKINIALCVGPRRADGFHELGTVFHAVSLHDQVQAVSRTDGRITLTMAGEGSEQLPCDQTNLAVRAAWLLRERHGDPHQGVDLRIDKQIPMAGGMAGGSADAAGTLLACVECWQLEVSLDELAELAAELGSDVPFLLFGGNALGTGRGERLRILPAGGRLEWVFALAEHGLSTPEVYGRFDDLAERGALVPSSLLTPDELAELLSGEPERVAAALRNDLQAAAVDLYPELAETLAAGRAIPGVLGGLVCGSGPTCAFLCVDANSADAATASLGGEPVVRAVRRGHGPVAGPDVARLV